MGNPGCLAPPIFLADLVAFETIEQFDATADSIFQHFAVAALRSCEMIIAFVYIGRKQPISGVFRTLLAIPQTWRFGEIEVYGRPR
jgi:hypothetical protein